MAVLAKTETPGVVVASAIQCCVRMNEAPALSRVPSLLVEIIAAIVVDGTIKLKLLPPGTVR